MDALLSNAKAFLLGKWKVCVVEVQRPIRTARQLWELGARKEAFRRTEMATAYFQLPAKKVQDPTV